MYDYNHYKEYQSIAKTLREMNEAKMEDAKFSSSEHEAVRKALDAAVDHWNGQVPAGYMTSLKRMAKRDKSWTFNTDEVQFMYDAIADLPQHAKTAAMLKRKLSMAESVELDEAKMEDAEVLEAAKALAANGKDEKTKSFGKGLVSFYEKNKSFTPDQVAGLQNIMKNAPFQMAKEEVDLTEISYLLDEMGITPEDIDALSEEDASDMMEDFNVALNELNRAAKEAEKGNKSAAKWTRKKYEAELDFQQQLSKNYNKEKEGKLTKKDKGDEDKKRKETNKYLHYGRNSAGVSGAKKATDTGKDAKKSIDNFVKLSRMKGVTPQDMKDLGAMNRLDKDLAKYNKAKDDYRKEVQGKAGIPTGGNEQTFMIAASLAKRKGMKKFYFNGKSYPVTIKTDVAKKTKE